MQNAASFWNKIAKKYASLPIADIESYNYTLERTRSYLSADDTVLEVGCGTGSTALLLAGDVAKITASDLAVNMIKVGSQKAQDQNITNVKFVTAEIFGRALENDPYDVVLAFNILHLLPDTTRSIGRMNDLIKPGGFFISKTICQPVSGLAVKFRLMKILLPIMQVFGKAPFVKFMEIEELENIITSYGFRIIETGNYPASPPSRYIVAQKI